MKPLYRQRDYVLYWSAGLVSATGDWAMGVGLPIFVFILTHSVLATGAMLVAGRAPRIFLGPLAGVFADRYDRRIIAVVTNALLAATVFLLVLVRNPSLVWIVYVECALLSAIDTFFGPAANALRASIVSREQYTRASVFGVASENIARLIGPALGGVVTSMYGLPGLVFLDSTSFAAAAILLLLIRTRSPRPAIDEATRTQSLLGRVWHEWIAGLHALWQNATLRTLFGAFSITVFGEGFAAVLFPVFVYERLHGGAPQLSVIMTSQAVGSLLALGLLVRGHAWLLSRYALGLSSFCYGLISFAVIAAAGFAGAYHIVIVLFVCGGVIAMILLTGFASLIQLRSPERFRGRLSGTMMNSTALVRLIGVVLASVLTQRLGLVPMLSVMGAGYVAAGVVVLLFLPRSPPPVDEVPADNATR